MKYFLTFIISIFIGVAIALTPATIVTANDADDLPICYSSFNDIIYEYPRLSFGDWYKLQNGLYDAIIEYLDSDKCTYDDFVCRNGPRKISSFPYIFNQTVKDDINYHIDTLKWNASCDTIYNHNITFTRNEQYLTGFIITTTQDTIYALGPSFSDLKRGWSEIFPEEEKEMFDRMKISFNKTIFNDMRKPVKDFVYPECIYNYFARIIIKNGKVDDIQTLYSRDLKYQQADQIWKNR